LRFFGRYRRRQGNADDHRMLDLLALLRGVAPNHRQVLADRY
jgi:hypothetical protein